jgi:lipopolysaccharide transport system permease protein
VGDSSLRGNPVVRLVKDCWAARELAWRMLHRDLSVKYRQSFLGYLWAVVPPLGMTLSFILAGEAQIINTAGTSIPYPVFALLGTVLWQTFAEAIQGPIRAVTAAKPLLARIRLPYEAIILAKLGEVLLNLAIRLVLVAVALAIYGVYPTMSLLFAPIAVAVLLVLGTAIGLLLAPLAGLYGDVELTLSMVLSLWFFVTPVMYEQAAAGSTISALNAINPVAPAIVAGRESLSGMPLSVGPGFAIFAALAGGAVVLGWLVYRRSLAYMVERVSA